jgi:hypothetical protein
LESVSFRGCIHFQSTGVTTIGDVEANNLCLPAGSTLMWIGPVTLCIKICLLEQSRSNEHDNYRTTSLVYHTESTQTHDILAEMPKKVFCIEQIYRSDVKYPICQSPGIEGQTYVNYFALEKYFPGVVLGLKCPIPASPPPQSNFVYW